MEDRAAIVEAVALRAEVERFVPRVRGEAVFLRDEEVTRGAGRRDALELRDEAPLERFEETRIGDARAREGDRRVRRAPAAQRLVAVDICCGSCERVDLAAEDLLVRQR